MNKLWRKVKQQTYGHVVLCGDLNAISNHQLDISNTTYRKGFRTTISSFTNLTNLYDLWRCHHSTEKDFTFFSQVHLSYSRIDMFLLDKFLLQKISKSEIGTITWTDHAPVSITVGSHGFSTWANRWKNNVHLFSDSAIALDIETLLIEFFNKNDTAEVNPFVLWTAHKAFIRGILMKHSALLKRKRRQHMDTILRALNPKIKNHLLWVQATNLHGLVITFGLYFFHNTYITHTNSEQTSILMAIKQINYWQIRLKTK